MHRVATICVLFATAVSAQPATQSFLDELNHALQSGDRTAVVRRVRFPVVVSIGGVRVPLQDAGALLDRYDDIFTPELRGIVARRADVVDTPDGFSVGAGALEVRQTGGDLNITAIVVPSVSVAPESSASLAGASRSSEPRRIALRAGTQPTRFAGNLLAGAVDSYIVFVPKGQLLDVRLERVRSEAVVRVVSAATGAPLNPRTAQGGLVVSGRALTSADYHIDVQRTSTGDDHLPYMLAVSIR